MQKALSIAAHNEAFAALTKASPEVLAWFAAQPKPRRTFCQTLRGVDLRASDTALLVMTGVAQEVGHLQPLRDPAGYPIELAAVNYLAPDELAMVNAAHDARLATLRQGAPTLPPAMLPQWAADRTAWFVVDRGPSRWFDFHAVRLAGGIALRREGMLSLSGDVLNLVNAVAAVDPLLCIAWAETEHEAAAPKTFAPWTDRNESASDLETLLVETAGRAINKRGGTVGELRAILKAMQATRSASESEAAQ